MKQREAQRLERFDSDGDGVLSPEERKAAAQILRNEKQKSLQSRTATVKQQNQQVQNKREIALIQRFDSNGDGVLSAGERTRADQILDQERQGNRSAPKR